VWPTGSPKSTISGDGRVDGRSHECRNSWLPGRNWHSFRPANGFFSVSSLSDGHADVMVPYNWVRSYTIATVAGRKRVTDADPGGEERAAPHHRLHLASDHERGPHPHRSQCAGSREQGGDLRLRRSGGLGRRPGRLQLAQAEIPVATSFRPRRAGSTARPASSED